MNTANNDLPRTGKNKKPSNELLEEIEHERVDSGTTTAASKEYQKVEAVEKVNRGKDSRGKG